MSGKREYIDGYSITEITKRLGGVTRANLSRILNGKQGISAEMSIRLSHPLGTNPNFWLDLQKSELPNIGYFVLTNPVDYLHRKTQILTQ